MDYEIIETLIKASVQASKYTYSPYSNFPVGAAVLCQDSTIFSACNVENISYGLTVCAEQAAICKSISEGHRDIKAIAVYSPYDDPVTPCGKCRQFIQEFGKIDVYLVKQDLTAEKYSIDYLLPHAFVKKKFN